MSNKNKFYFAEYKNPDKSESFIVTENIATKRVSSINLYIDHESNETIFMATDHDDMEDFISHDPNHYFDNLKPITFEVYKSHLLRVQWLMSRFFANHTENLEP